MDGDSRPHQVTGAIAGLSPWVREALRCPACHGEVRDAEMDPAHGPSAVICAACGVSYPVRDGIVHLLAAEATPR
ncbi:MAG: Trm112 family protein [Bifidobacteriaceae bacterium]|nr:Trm112 family protein [Bifidobacteriaceae bacterium]